MFIVTNFLFMQCKYLGDDGINIRRGEGAVKVRDR
jgi:hypothetical protein